MARMIPPHYPDDCSSPGEIKLFHQFREAENTEDWVVLHSLWISHHPRQIVGECDFVIIVPEMGAVCLEVKGCRTLRMEEGLWYYGSDPTGKAKSPFRQAEEAKYAIQAVISRFNSELRRVPFTSAVVFPFVPFQVKSDEWFDWQVIDVHDLRLHGIAYHTKAVLNHALKHLGGYGIDGHKRVLVKSPDADRVKQITTILRPNYEVFESPRLRISRLDEEVKRYTDEQVKALDMIDSNPRVLFTGPAGTGKTVLALEAARRATGENKSVLFLCFNRLLGKMLQSWTKPLGNLVHTITLHAFLMELAGTGVTPDDGNDFWQNRLPDIVLERLLEGAMPTLQYDVLIVDEAQDIMHEPYLDILDMVVKQGLHEGCWRMFGDFEKQMIFAHEGVTKDEFCNLWGRSSISSLVLRRNCRNTPRIASLVNLICLLDPCYREILRKDDQVEPTLLYYDSEKKQREHLIASLEMLDHEGYSGTKVVVLSFRSDVNCAATMLDSPPWDQRLKPFSEAGKGHVRYSSIHAYKGLESPAVVVTDIDGLTGERAVNLLYIAATRALHRLVLIGSEKSRMEMLNALKPRMNT
jgi:UvrD-like helicase C-terminal domain/Nuclease-related domain/AAA domain